MILREETMLEIEGCKSNAGGGIFTVNSNKEGHGWAYIPKYMWGFVRKGE